MAAIYELQGDTLRFAYESDFAPKPVAAPTAFTAGGKWRRSIVLKRSTTGAAPGEKVAATPADRQSLLNGRDLTGWKAYGTPRWSWNGGRVVGQPSAQGPGFLMTEKDFENFDLEFEFKLNAGLGSGLFLRADPNGPISGGNQLEIQLLDDFFPKFASLLPIQKTGSVYGVLARTADPKLKRNDWNTMRVRLDKERIQIWVNQAEVLNTDLTNAPADKRQQNPGLTRKSGKIGFQQNQQTDVEIRNVRVQELPR
jgi:hypothetical protein